MALPMTKLNSVKISLPLTLSLSVRCKENGQQERKEQQQKMQEAIEVN
ncbi:124_t:CDS:2 [Funneliformis geosporum]|nr:124_t:CDS:2 [Funneliformis geosporum]